jgi:hypothetical protein
MASSWKGITVAEPLMRQSSHNVFLALVDKICRCVNINANVEHITSNDEIQSKTAAL